MNQRLPAVEPPFQNISDVKYLSFILYLSMSYIVHSKTDNLFFQTVKLSLKISLFQKSVFVNQSHLFVDQLAKPYLTGHKLRPGCFLQVVITLMTSQKVPTYHFQCQRISENNENLAVHGNYNYHDTGFLYKKLKETLSKIILEHRNILGVKKDHCPILSENCLIRIYIPHLHEEIIHLINVA